MYRNQWQIERQIAYPIMSGFVLYPQNRSLLKVKRHTEWKTSNKLVL